MAVFADYALVRSDNTEATVTPSNPGEWAFVTHARKTGHENPAVLTFSLRSLGEAKDVRVKVNNQQVGFLRNYHGEDARNWHMQQILFPSTVLEASGKNELEIAVESGDLKLGGIICHFKQEG